MVFVEFVIEALLFARVDARKTAPSRFSRSGTNVRQAIRERHSTPRLRDTVQLLCASIILTHPLFDTHEAQGPFLMTQPRAKDQRLASPCVSIFLSTNTRIVLSSSCVEGKTAVKPYSYRPSPNYVLSRPRAFLPSTQLCLMRTLTLNSTFLSDVTPNHRFLLRGVACSHENLGRRGLHPLGMLGKPLMSRPSIISLGGVTSPAVTLGGRASACSAHLLVSYHGFGYIYIGKSHRGAIIYWGKLILTP